MFLKSIIKIHTSNFQKKIGKYLLDFKNPGEKTKSDLDQINRLLEAKLMEVVRV